MTAQPISLVRSEDTGGLVADISNDVLSLDQWEGLLTRQLNLNSPQLAKSLLRDTINACGLSRQSPVEDINATLHALLMLQPKDILELQLMAQMLSVSRQSFELMGLAAGSLSIENRELYLGFSTRLMRLYTRQLETLGKYRHKPQVIRIEKVTMDGNSQAVFGTAGSGGQ